MHKVQLGGMQVCGNVEIEFLHSSACKRCCTTPGARGSTCGVVKLQANMELEDCTLEALCDSKRCDLVSAKGAA
jgi:hypothetical protein